MTYAGLLGISVFAIILLILNIKNLLIGCNKISNPLYDTAEKKGYLKKKSLVGIVLIIIGIVIIISVVLS